MPNQNLILLSVVYHKDRYWDLFQLYLLYTSPLAEILKHHNMCYHLYANDTQIYVSFATNDDNSPNSSITKIENCLSDINLWMTANKLKLNKSKTDLIYIYSRNNPQTSLPSIQQPATSRTPEKSFYVDDLFTGEDNSKKGLAVYKKAKKIMAKGGFSLRKWKTNSQDLQRTIN